MRIRIFVLSLLATLNIALPFGAMAQGNTIVQAARPTPSPTPTPTSTTVATTNPTMNPGAASIVTPGISANVFGDSVTILVELFVLAVVLESALALLFHWLPFQATFNARGVKPLVSFAAALMLTVFFRTEIFAKLVLFYGGRLDQASGTLGQVIDAMVIAGGSSAVHTMLQKLGIRLPTSSEGDTPRPPPSKAWFAVLLTRKQAKGPVQVGIAPVPDALASAVWQTCGTIPGARPIRGALRFFLRDYSRFPATAGWSIPPQTSYYLRLTGFDANGEPIASEPYGPLTLAPGAVVDIDLTL